MKSFLLQAPDFGTTSLCSDRGKRDRKIPCRPAPPKALVNHEPHRVRLGVHDLRFDAFQQHLALKHPLATCPGSHSSEERNYTQLPFHRARIFFHRSIRRPDGLRTPMHPKHLAHARQVQKPLSTEDRRDANTTISRLREAAMPTFAGLYCIRDAGSRYRFHRRPLRKLLSREAIDQ